MRALPIRTTAGVTTLVVSLSLVIDVSATPVTAAAIAAKTRKSHMAGYTAVASTVTSVDATVTLPTFTCPKKSEGVGAVVADYDPTNDAFSMVEPYLLCSDNKVAGYGAILDADGVDTTPAVKMKGGDTVVMSLSCGSGGSRVSIDDTTTGSSFNSSSSTSSACTGAYVFDGGFLKDKGSGFAPLPSFGAIDYSSVTVNGAAIGSLDPVASNYDEGTKDIIDTGSLTNAGTAFTTTQQP